MDEDIDTRVEEIQNDPQLAFDRLMYGSSYVKMWADGWERLDPRPFHGWSDTDREFLVKNV